MEVIAWNNWKSYIDRPKVWWYYQQNSNIWVIHIGTKLMFHARYVATLESDTPNQLTSNVLVESHSDPPPSQIPRPPSILQTAVVLLPSPTMVPYCFSIIMSTSCVLFCPLLPLLLPTKKTRQDLTQLPLTQLANWLNKQICCSSKKWQEER